MALKRHIWRIKMADSVGNAPTFVFEANLVFKTSAASLYLPTIQKFLFGLLFRDG